MAMNDAFREAASIDRRIAQRALGKMRSPMHGRAVNSGTQKAARPKLVGRGLLVLAGCGCLLTAGQAFAEPAAPMKRTPTSGLSAPIRSR